MKKLLYIPFVLFAVISTGCEKDYPGDSYDFSATKAPFVELKSKTAVTVKQGSSFNVTAQVRTAFGSVTTATYQLTGALTSTGNIVIARNKTEGVAAVAVPAGTVPAGQTSVTAQLKLTTAQNADGTLSIGYLDPAKEVISIKITP